MKRADIKTGVVYGYEEHLSRHYRYDPVVVLSTDLYMIDRYKRTLSRADMRHNTITSGRTTGFGNAVGLLVVFPSFTSKHAQYDELLARLLELSSVEAAVAGINGAGRDIKDGVDAQTGKDVVLGRYGLLTNQRYLHGDYSTLQAELDEADRRRKERADAADKERRIAVDRHNQLADQLADQLDALGFTGYHVMTHASPDSYVRIKVDDLEQLLVWAERYNSEHPE